MADYRQRCSLLAATVAALLALPAAASATAPWSGSAGPILDASTPAPSTSIPYEGAYKRSTRTCRGRVALSLKRGADLLQHRSVKLNRRCRFSVTFEVARADIGDATHLLVVRRLSGQGATSSVVRVPAEGSDLLGSRGTDPAHVAPSAIEVYEPFRPPGLVPR